MDFTLAEEHRMLQDMAYKFAVAEVEPHSFECDELEKPTPEIRKKAAENGLVEPWIPEEYGGSGVGQFGNILVVEQISRVDIGIGLNIYIAGFGSQNILAFGTEEQKQEYLPRVASGEIVFAGAYTEPNAGTDVSGYKTKAIKDGDDYVINGQKMFISNGMSCDYMLCQCITHPEERAHKSFSQIIVPANALGVMRNKIKGKMGIRANDTADIALEDVRVPQTSLVGTEMKGFVQLMNFFDVTRVMIAAQALGLCQGCLDEAIKYSKERVVFGKPLSSYQLTMQKITEMAIKTEALRNMTYKAAWMLDSENPDYHLSAMAKYLGGQAAVFCANAAVEIHGGYGYIDEYKVQKYYRDAKILELYEGTKEAEIMALGRVLMA